MSMTDDIADFVDANASGLGPADLIFVFGSTLPDAVTPALHAFRAGLAPLIVLTGGPNRRNPAVMESDAHAQLLHAHGITSEQLLVERRSQTSKENVEFARPLIEERLGPVRTMIAAVFPVKSFCSIAQPGATSTAPRSSTTAGAAGCTEWTCEASCSSVDARDVRIATDAESCLSTSPIHSGATPATSGAWGR